MKIFLIDHEMQVPAQILGLDERLGAEVEIARDLDNAGRLIAAGAYELVVLNPDIEGLNAGQLFDFQHSVYRLGGTLIVSSLGKTIDMLLRLITTIQKMATQYPDAKCQSQDGKRTAWPQVVQERGQNTFNEISYDTYGMRVWVRKELITLTKREFDLLVFLSITRTRSSIRAL